MPAGPLTPDAAPDWDDAGLLQQAHTKAIALLTSVLAQADDLNRSATPLAADSLLDTRAAFARTADALRAALAALDDTLPPDPHRPT